MEDIGDEVKALSKKYPLSIPPWFGLIVRTFSALEGLGLGLDGNYSIVNQCFPYLSRRLLTDDDPRIRAALKSFLYGKDQQLKVEVRWFVGSLFVASVSIYQHAHISQ